VTNQPCDQDGNSFKPEECFYYFEELDPLPIGQLVSMTVLGMDPLESIIPYCGNMNYDMERGTH
jgi:hypothetical protein